VLAFKIIPLAERYSPSSSKGFAVVFKIISVTGLPTSSCFVARFQVISVADRFTASYFQFVTVPLFNIISVADHFALSCCFVELFSKLIATLRFFLSVLLRFK